MLRFAMPFALAAALLTSGAVAQHHPVDREQQRFEATLAGLQPGTPQNCVERYRVTEIQPYSNTILFRAGRNRLWRSDIVGRCAGLGEGDVPVIAGTGGRFCAGDHVSTRATTGGYVTGSCTLGVLTPYSK
jgi:hypothetical protein